MNITENITRIRNAKSAIKTAIEAKGVTVGNGKIETFAEKIGQIPSGSPTPTIGFLPVAWDNEGYVTEGTLYGVSDVPEKYFSAYGYSSSGAAYSGPPFFTHMATINFDEPIIRIGDNSFRGIPVSNIDLSTVQEIGANNFYGNKALTSIDISSAITIGASAFYGCGLASLTLPSSLTAIGASAFCACNQIRGTIEIPGSVITIGGRAFMQCLSTSGFILNEGIEEIGGDAFRQCNLGSITLPSTITTIGANAFYNNPTLTTINCRFAEGAVSGAPWGAPNATINYDYTGD